MKLRVSYSLTPRRIGVWIEDAVKTPPEKDTHFAGDQTERSETGTMRGKDRDERN